MGNTYSKEVYEFRKQCKEEAKKLSFLPNKVAKNHILNYAPKQTKDPRSEQQFKAWEENISYDTLQPLHGSAREAGESFVVDIMDRAAGVSARSIQLCRSQVRDNFS